MQQPAALPTAVWVPPSTEHRLVRRLGWLVAPADGQGRGLRVAAFLPQGVVNEAWAGLRLMPYGWHFVAMRLGYAHARWAELRAREAAGLASGQPALDFVGVGGDAMLAPEAGLG